MFLGVFGKVGAKAQTTDLFQRGEPNGAGVSGT